MIRLYEYWLCYLKLIYRDFFSSRLRLQAFMFSQQRLSCTAERAPCVPTIQLYSSAICDHADFRLHMEIGSDFLFSMISCLFINDIRIFRSSKLYVLRVPLKDADAILSRARWNTSVRLFRSWDVPLIKPNSDWLLLVVITQVPCFLSPPFLSDSISAADQSLNKRRFKRC